MLKKTISFVDYDGHERKEDYYFNLDEGEIMEMELSVSGGFSTMVAKVVAEDRHPELFKIFKEMVLKSYGEKSGDGRYFMKEDENGYSLARKFMQTKAYSALMMELTNDGKAAAEFVNGIMPADMAAKYSAKPAPAVN